jgi:MFS family permease
MTSKEISQPSNKAPRFFYGYVIIAVNFIILGLSSGLILSFGVFFDPLLEQFGWTRTMISGANSLSSVLSGVLAIAMGGLADRFGPRLVVTFCGFCLGLGYFMMSQVNAVWQLYLFYGVLIGIGGGLFVTVLSSIARWFVMRRSLMTGIVVSGLSIGQLIGPLVISRLIGAHGWRFSCAILGVAALLIIVLLAQFLRRDPGKVDQLLGDQIEGKEKNFKSTDKDFILKEAYHTKQFWLVTIIFFCTGFTIFAFIIHIIPNATKLGISTVTAANILAVSGGAGIIGNFVLGGIIGDRIGNRKAFMIGIFLMAVSLFWLVFARDVWMLYLFAIIFGIGLGCEGTSESPLIARLFGLGSHGLIYGVVTLSTTVGASVGPVLIGYMCDVFGNYQLAFLLSAVICVLGLVLLVILRPTKRRRIEL